MLTIKVLGPGCYNCYAMERVTATSLEALLEEHPSIEAILIHVIDPKGIKKYPNYFAPTLLINEKPVCSGRIPTVREVNNWLQTALTEQGENATGQTQDEPPTLSVHGQ